MMNVSTGTSANSTLVVRSSYTPNSVLSRSVLLLQVLDTSRRKKKQVFHTKNNERIN